MTHIKYGTVQVDPHRQRAMWARGKKGSSFIICDCDNCNREIRRLIEEKVVELPDRMTPTEYDEWKETEDGKAFIRDHLIEVEEDHEYRDEESGEGEQG